MSGLFVRPRAIGWGAPAATRCIMETSQRRAASRRARRSTAEASARRSKLLWAFSAPDLLRHCSASRASAPCRKRTPGTRRRRARDRESRVQQSTLGHLKWVGMSAEEEESRRPNDKNSKRSLLSGSFESWNVAAMAADLRRWSNSALGGPSIHFATISRDEVAPRSPSRRAFRNGREAKASMRERFETPLGLLSKNMRKRSENSRLRIPGKACRSQCSGGSASESRDDGHFFYQQADGRRGVPSR